MIEDAKNAQGISKAPAPVEIATRPTKIKSVKKQGVPSNPLTTLNSRETDFHRVLLEACVHCRRAVSLAC
jgi:hypothetical protein